MIENNILKQSIKQVITFVKAYWFVLFAILAIIILRIPSLFDRLRGGDEDYYMAMGQHITNGRTLYIGIWDNKPPLLYLIYTFSYALFGPHLLFVRSLNLILSILALIYTYKIISLKYFNLSKIAIIVSTLVSGILWSVGWQIYGFNAENLYTPLIIIGSFYFIKFITSIKNNDNSISQIDTSQTKIFQSAQLWLASICFSLSGFTKLPSLFEVLFLTFVFSIIILKKTTFRKFLFFGSLTFGLITLPYIITGLYYLNINQLAQLYFSLYGFSNYYLQDSIKFLNISLLSWRLIITVFVLLLTTVLFWFKKISAPLFFLINIFFVEVFTIFISGFNWPHYLIQFIPAFSFFVALALYCFTNKFEKDEKKHDKKYYLTKYLYKFYGFICLVLVWFVTFVFNNYNLELSLGMRTNSNYGAFLEVLAGQRTLANWQLLDRWEVQLTDTMVPIIQKYTNSNDLIHIVASRSYLYPISNRLSGHPYPVDYQYHESLESVYNKLRASNTKLIILEKGNNNYDTFSKLVIKDYQLKETVEGKYEFWLMKASTKN
jgi:hypothetical protein